jgi:hypothetical protein
LNEFQNKIKLPIEDTLVYSIVTLTGWGSISNYSCTQADTLQKSFLQIIYHDYCAKMFNFPIRVEQLCGLSGEGKGTYLVSVGDINNVTYYNQERTY